MLGQKVRMALFIHIVDETDCSSVSLLFISSSDRVSKDQRESQESQEGEDRQVGPGREGKRYKGVWICV